MAHVAAKQSVFTRLLAAPFQRFMISRRARKQLNELLTLSDTLLRDIGVSRLDVEFAIRKVGLFSAKEALADVTRARVAANMNSDRSYHWLAA